jgi:hypothetical protein
LLAFKFFFWADKKIHHVSYTENKEDINEDLLSDFIGSKALTGTQNALQEEKKM